MEELRSTEVLDKEIRAESVKKAEKILASAEAKAQELLAGVDLRVAETKKTAEENMKSRLALYEKNVNASVPLERQRYLVSFINNSVMDAINDYMGSLTQDRKDSLIEKELAKAKNIIGARKVTCLAVGKMDSASCEKIVKSVLGNVVAGCTASSGEEKNCLEYGLILKTEDGKLKCRLTLEEIINNLLARKREELALALFDGRLPE